LDAVLGQNIGDMAELGIGFGLTVLNPTKISKVARKMKFSSDRAQKINNRKPMNSQYANNTFPLAKLPTELRQKIPA
jgi:hypothetical protein